jgi:hypothetical protein
MKTLSSRQYHLIFMQTLKYLDVINKYFEPVYFGVSTTKFVSAGQMRRAAGAPPCANGCAVKVTIFRVRGPTQSDARSHFGRLICVAPLEMSLKEEQLQISPQIYT